MVYDQIWDEPAVWRSLLLGTSSVLSTGKETSGLGEEGAGSEPVTPSPSLGRFASRPLHFTFSAEEAQAHKALVKVTQPGTDGQGLSPFPNKQQVNFESDRRRGQKEMYLPDPFKRPLQHVQVCWLGICLAA